MTPEEITKELFPYADPKKIEKERFRGDPRGDYFFLGKHKIMLVEHEERKEWWLKSISQDS